MLTLLLCATLHSQVPVKIIGEMHKLVLFDDGTVGGWGDTRDGQLGPRASIPNSSGHSRAYVPIQIPGKAVDIAAGGRTSYVLLNDGSVLAFGWGMYGQLGCGEPCRKGSETPVQVTGLRDVVRIAASGYTAFAVHPDGTVSTWGMPDHPTPVRVDGVANVAELSVGAGHVLALTKSGTVLAWGRLPIRRQQEDVAVRAPAEVPGLTDVVQVVATGIAAVLKKDGTVWVWGNNGQGQFGNGKRDDADFSATPVPVPGLTNVAAISGASNGRHFLALLKNGTVRAWGNSDWGQAGNGVTGKEQAAHVALKLTGVTAVFAAGNSSFAVAGAANELWIWGHGASYPGEWPMPRNAPVPVRLAIPAGVVAP